MQTDILESLSTVATFTIKQEGQITSSFTAYALNTL